MSRAENRKIERPTVDGSCDEIGATHCAEQACCHSRLGWIRDGFFLEQRALARSLAVGRRCRRAGCCHRRDLELDSLCNFIAIITNPLAVVRSTHIHIRHAVVFRHTLASRRGRRVRVQLRLELLLVALAYRPRRGGKFWYTASIDSSIAPPPFGRRRDRKYQASRPNAQCVHLSDGSGSKRLAWTLCGAVQAHIYRDLPLHHCVVCGIPAPEHAALAHERIISAQDRTTRCHRSRKGADALLPMHLDTFRRLSAVRNMKC